MAELMIGPLVSLLKEKVSSYLLNQYKVMQGMEEQREILGRRLLAILDVIEDAEKGASRAGVSAWLQALKKVSYEAIDVFDEFKYEALRRDAKKKGHYSKLSMDFVSLFPARNPIVFRYRMGKKLRKIVEAIEVLVKEMNDFGFTQRQQVPPSKQWRMTVSVMVDSEKEIVSRSRDEEKRMIMKILLEQESSSDLMVLPIVGAGGLGKTTFAQLIYNDPIIKNHFELCRWCCVSDDFDVGKIARTICQTNEQVICEKALQDLQREVSGKKYLIVLDDVWDRDADEWGKLKTCLKQGGKGSAILTTTRDAEVARIMTAGVDEAYNLEKLGKEYLKEIIQSRAFYSQKPNSDDLEDIIDKIVVRCDGSPLAAKAFGSILRTKTSVLEYNDVLTRSNICNESDRISRILMLSYDDLPSHMKMCFSFCAIFPKDYEIDVETLIQLWMAHDFIPAPGEGRPETAGRETFLELTWRSFFQDVNQSSPVMYGQRKLRLYRTTCKIHDLMHDLALSFMGNECVTITGLRNKKELLSSDALNLFSSYRTRVLDNFLKKQSSNLRTLLYTCKYSCGPAPDMSRYKSLRALELHEFGMHPLRTGHLQHLRYLNLSDNEEIRELPEEISILFNLQMLDVSDCKNLHRLPKGMKYLTCLQHLYTNGCKSLKCMPPDMGQLTALQTLTYFVAGSNSGCSTVRELNMLDLGGELELNGLENVTEAHAKAVCLQKKDKLTHLSLRWTESHEESIPDCHKNVLHALNPHGGLEMLKVDSYKGNSLPSWMTDLSLLQHLTELHLVGCTLCETFPQFCHLKALQVLYLEKLDKLRSLCSNITFITFPSLKELELHDLKSLDGWVSTEGKEEVIFPVLEKVSVKNCPNLTSLPEAPKLKVLNVNEDKAHLSLLTINSRYMSFLSELKLSVEDRESTLQLDFENQESSLSQLSIDGCNFFFPSSPSHPTIGVWRCFGKLVDLKIRNCDELIYWPEEVFQSLVSLKNLQIESCNKLIGRKKVKREPRTTADQVLPHLNSIYIHSCGSLVELLILPPSLGTILIVFCVKLERIWGKEGHQSDTCTALGEPSDSHTSTSAVEQPSAQAEHPPPFLENLMIVRCDSFAALPNLPSSLKKLYITGCQELCSVSGQLGALERAHIDSCSRLQSLDSFGDLPSLDLRVKSCKRLASLPGGHGSYSALRRVELSSHGYETSLQTRPAAA